jgi:hypothetical protein
VLHACKIISCFSIHGQQQDWTDVLSIQCDYMVEETQISTADAGFKSYCLNKIVVCDNIGAASELMKQGAEEVSKVQSETKFAELKKYYSLCFKIGWEKCFDWD